MLAVITVSSSSLTATTLITGWGWAGWGDQEGCHRHSWKSQVIFVFESLESSGPSPKGPFRYSYPTLTLPVLARTTQAGAIVPRSAAEQSPNLVAKPAGQGAGWCRSDLWFSV